MKKVPHSLQFQSEHFTGVSYALDDSYRRMLETGHAYRPSAGSMIKAMQAVAKKKKITDKDVKKIIKAATSELKGTPHALADIFESDIRNFYGEFGHRFDESATAAIEAEFPNLKPPPNLTDEKSAPNFADINGWFHAITADGKITEEDADLLADGYRRKKNSYFKANLGTLYTSDKVKFEGKSLLNLRANIGDPAWMQQLDVNRAVSKAFNRKKPAGLPEIRTMTVTLKERLGRKFERQFVGKVFREALKQLGLKMDALEMTGPGRAALEELLDGRPAIDRILKELEKKPSADKLLEFADAVIWAYGIESNPEQGGLVDKLEEALGVPYYDFKNVPVATVFKLDRALRCTATAERRRMIDTCDLLGTVDFCKTYSLNAVTEVSHKKRKEPVIVTSTNEGIEVEDYLDGATLMIGMAPKPLIQKRVDDRVKSCSPKEVAALMKDAVLVDIVRGHLHNHLGSYFAWGKES